MTTVLRTLMACLTIIGTPLGQPTAPRAQPSVVYVPMVSSHPDVLAFVLTSRYTTNADIAVANVDATDHALLTHTAMGERAVEPVYAPDATRIAFIFHTGNASSVCVMNADGSAITPLTTIATPDSHARPVANHPTWSPDGAQIAFGAVRNNGAEIDIINADGSNLHRLVSNGWNPAWAPDGRQIAFLSRADDNSEIYTIRPDGTNLTRLTTTPAYEVALAWSPDARQLAVARSAVPGMVIMTADGTEERQLASLGEISHLSWSSDGTRLAYAGYNPLYDVFIGIVASDGTNAMRFKVDGWTSDPAWQPRPTR